MVKSVQYSEVFVNSTLKDYFSLLKPRVMSLVVFTAFTGLYLAPGKIHPFIAFVSILCTAIGSGAAGCLNMWYDKDIDTIMKRTQTRPLVRGVIEAEEALSMAIILSIISVLGMVVCVNFISALILAISICFYYFVYTVWLKRTSIQNIVIGGAAGAFPPIIGWTSVTAEINFEAICLFLIIFLWTPPHFWSLALYRSEDYKKANIPMMPVILGEEYTKNQIGIYTILMVFSSFLPFLTGMSGFVYLVIATLLNGYFLYLVAILKLVKGIKICPKIFGYSIIYLFALFLVMIIDKMITIF